MYLSLCLFFCWPMWWGKAATRLLLLRKSIISRFHQMWVYFFQLLLTWFTFALWLVFEYIEYVTSFATLVENWLNQHQQNVISDAITSSLKTTGTQIGRVYCRCCSYRSLSSDIEQWCDYWERLHLGAKETNRKKMQIWFSCNQLLQILFLSWNEYKILQEWGSW